MNAFQGKPIGSEECVKDVFMHKSNIYAFVEFQTTEQASTALALNGVPSRGLCMTVRRTTRYKPIFTSTSEQDNKKLPILGMHGMHRVHPVNDHHLSRAQHVLSEAKRQIKKEILKLFLSGDFAQKITTRVVCLTQAVSRLDLSNDEEYNDILEDMTDTLVKYGKIISLVIPRPDPCGQSVVPGLGNVYVEYMEAASSTLAILALNLRTYDGNVVFPVCFPEENFLNGEYSI